MRPTLPCPGDGGPALPGNPALAALAEFRRRLHGCLTARADALFDLADAVEFDSETLRRSIESVRPGMEVFEVSAKTGDGMEAWVRYLESRRRSSMPQTSVAVR